MNVVQELALRAAIKSEYDIDEERTKAEFKLDLFRHLIAAQAPKHAWELVEGDKKYVENEDGTVAEDEWDTLPELDDYEVDPAERLAFIEEQVAQFDFKGYMVEDI